MKTLHRLGAYTTRRLDLCFSFYSDVLTPLVVRPGTVNDAAEIKDVAAINNNGIEWLITHSLTDELRY